MNQISVIIACNNNHDYALFSQKNTAMTFRWTFLIFGMTGGSSPGAFCRVFLVSG
jgi:hypothetical protein